MTEGRLRLFVIGLVIVVASIGLTGWILGSRYVACVCIRNDQSSSSSINVQGYGSLDLHFEGTFMPGEERCVPGDYQRHRNGPDFGGVRVTADGHVARFELPPLWGLNPQLRATRDTILLDRTFTLLPRVLPCR